MNRLTGTELRQHLYHAELEYESTANSLQCLLILKSSLGKQDAKVLRHIDTAIARERRRYTAAEDAKTAIIEKLNLGSGEHDVQDIIMDTSVALPYSGPKAKASITAEFINKMQKDVGRQGVFFDRMLELEYARRELSSEQIDRIAKGIHSYYMWLGARKSEAEEGFKECERKRRKAAVSPEQKRAMLGVANIISRASKASKAIKPKKL